MNKKKKILYKTGDFIGRYWHYIWFAGSFFVLFLFMEKHITELLHSDLSSEMVLAKMLSVEHSVLSPNWHYSTEIRVISTQLVMTPLFMIFHNWHTIRVVGSMILFLLYLLSYYYFCRQAKIKKAFFLSAAFLILPYTGDYFEVVLYGICYIPYIASSFIMLGLIFQWLNSEKRYARILLLGLAVVLSVLLGMGGVRQLLVFYAPILCTAVICMVIHYREFKKYNLAEILCNKWCRLGEISFIVTVSAGIGYIINTQVLYKKYYFHSYEMVEYTSFSWDAVVEQINGILRQFGWRSGEYIFSSGTICNGICFILLLLTIYAVGSILKRRNKLGDEVYISAIFCTVGMLTLTAVFALTYLQYEDRYNLPVIMFAVPIVTAVLCSYARNNKKVEIACILLALGITFCSITNYEKYSEIDRTEEMREITEFLCTEGYTEGYSLFWNGGNLLTELSNGQIEVWVLADESSEDVRDIDHVHLWLQADEHEYIQPKGRCFMLLPQWRKQTYTIAKLLDNKNVIYESEEYVIYGYDSIQELKDDIAE